MCVQAITWAFKVHTGSPTRKVVLLALADSADAEHFECFPSLTHLASKTELSKRCVRKQLRELEEIGLISCQFRKDGYANLTIVYKLNVQPVPEAERGLQRGGEWYSPGGEEPRSPGWELRSVGVRNHVPPDPSIRSVNDPIEGEGETTARVVPIGTAVQPLLTAN